MSWSRRSSNASPQFQMSSRPHTRAWSMSVMFMKCGCVEKPKTRSSEMAPVNVLDSCQQLATMPHQHQTSSHEVSKAPPRPSSRGPVIVPLKLGFYSFIRPAPWPRPSAVGTNAGQLSQAHMFSHARLIASRPFVTHDMRLLRGATACRSPSLQLPFAPRKSPTCKPFPCPGIPISNHPPRFPLQVPKPSSRRNQVTVRKTRRLHDLSARALRNPGTSNAENTKVVCCSISSKPLSPLLWKIREPKWKLSSRSP